MGSAFHLFCFFFHNSKTRFRGNDIYSPKKKRLKQPNAKMFHQNRRRWEKKSSTVMPILVWWTSSNEPYWFSNSTGIQFCPFKPNVEIFKFINLIMLCCCKSSFSSFPPNESEWILISPVTNSNFFQSLYSGIFISFVLHSLW